MIGRRELAGGAVIVGLLAALAHGPALSGGFVYDDHWTIVENPHLRAPENLLRLLSPAPARAGVPDAGRPTLLATEIVDHLLWDLQPRGWHLQSLLWHGAVAVLFFLALAALTGELMLALAAAALFASHPLLVEPVAAINYREDLLATFFVLAALAAIGAARRRGQGRGGGRALAFALLAIGGFAKETAVMAPALLALLDIGAPPEERRARRLDQLALVLAAAVPIVWRAWAMGGAAVVSATAEIPDAHRSPLFAVPQAAWAFLCGVGQLLLPLRFSADYAELSRPALGWAALAAIAAGGALAFRFRDRQRWLAIGVLGGIAAYLPTAGLIPISNLRADRYFYLAALPLAVALGALLVRLRGQSLGVPRAALVLAVLVLALGLRARQQARVWRDDLTLWTHAVRVQPAASRAWHALAEARLRRGLLPGARAAVEQSLALADDPHARELQGIVLMEEGDLRGAHQALARALAAAEPHHRPEWLNNLGVCELRLGRLDSALHRFEEARRLAPQYRPAWLNAADALQRKGDADGARRLLQNQPRGPEGP